MSSEESVFTNSFNPIILHPLLGSVQSRQGWFLKITSLDNLSDFIKHFNNNLGKSFDPTAKSKEISDSLKVNMNLCFPNNNFLNFDFVKDEEQRNSSFYKKVYAFLLDENLNLVSSIAVHFFKEEGQQKFYSKIYDVCAAPNQSGTKILMLEILDKIKPISETIWLFVLADNHKAYNLYLDIGFEFVFSKVNNTFLQDMIYYDKKPISSKTYLGYTDLLLERRYIIRDMWETKMFENYISILSGELIPAIESEKLEIIYDKIVASNSQLRQNTILKFMTKISQFLNPVIQEQKSEMKEEDESFKLKKKNLQPILRIVIKDKNLFIFINSSVNNITNFDIVMYGKFKEKLENILLNFSNIDYEDLSILLRTQFPIETDVPIIDPTTKTYIIKRLKLNLFAVVNETEIKNYNLIEHSPIPVNPKDVYNININSQIELDMLDINVKHALRRGIKKICVKINNNVPINIENLYFKYNLLPSYSASPYKPNTFIYNVRRFNNINNINWEFDSFNFNNLYYIPDVIPDIQKKQLREISGCGLQLPLEEYYRDYLSYLNFNTQSIYKNYNPNGGDAITFSFIGYILNKCNPELVVKIFERFGIIREHNKLSTGSTLTTINLENTLSKTINYTGHLIRLLTIRGINSNELRTITSYDITRRIATLDSPLSIVPEKGDIYEILPLDFNDFNKLKNLTSFMTLNFLDYGRTENGLLHNMNILCHTVIVNFMCSLSHGDMINIDHPLDLERGQKLLMFTNPDNFFYIDLLNHILLDLILSENKIQRLFDCIELLNNTNIDLHTFINEYRDIIEILINNTSIQTNDVIVYTEKYYEHRLFYTRQEETKWLNCPFSILGSNRYKGTFNTFGDNKKFILTGNIDTNKINSDYSLNGLFINFNSDSNTGNNKVISFNFATRTVTCSEPIPINATRVIIGNLPNELLKMSKFWENIVVATSLSLDQTITNWITQVLISIDNTLLSFNTSVLTKNYETNDFIVNQYSNHIYNQLLSYQNFMSYTGINLSQLRSLSFRIAYSKIYRDFPSTDSFSIPMGIKTQDRGEIPNFTKTGQSYVKQYIAQNDVTFTLSSLISQKIKYNSFVCCRRISNHVGPINLGKLPGEIRVKELLQKRNLIPPQNSNP
jgi:hypothetical protein